MDTSRLKVHRRKLFLDGQALTVLSPRPDEAPALHLDAADDAVRISSSQAAAAALGQLCWAMAFQRSDHTVVVVPAEDTAVVVVNTDLGAPSPTALAELRSLLPLDAAPEGTVTLNTRSLESAIADEPAFYARQKAEGVGRIKHLHRLVKDVDGLPVLGAPGIVLKSWGVQLSMPDDSRPTWFAVSS